MCFSLPYITYRNRKKGKILCFFPLYPYITYRDRGTVRFCFSLRLPIINCYIILAFTNNLFLLLNYSTDTNECASVPCQNQGQCTDLVDAYICNCAPGWAGVNCETSKWIFFVVIRGEGVLLYFRLDIILIKWLSKHALSM